MSAPEIDIDAAKDLLAKGDAAFLDIRDPGSFLASHVPGAEHMHDGNHDAVVEATDKTKPVIVYCLKGCASRPAAAALLERGFSQVHSLKGGFRAWTAAKLEVAAGSPGVTVSPLAKEKLQGFLGEEVDTSVRIVLEPTGAFGLSLDVAAPGDVELKIDGLPFVLDGRLANAVKGLEIDFIDKVQGGGFSLKGGSPPERAGKADLLEDVKKRIADNKIMLFMKGTANQPMCGFSATTVGVLKGLGKPFGDKNVLETPEYRYVLSEHSSWPTIPQVFLDGKFIGGCDIVVEMSKSGDLQKIVGEAFA